MTYQEERLENLRRAKIPKPKKEKKPLRQKSLKKQEQEGIAKDERGGEDTDLQKWYKERQKQLVGKCMRCGLPYNKHQLRNAVAATAHILPKRPIMFPSIKLHPDNYIELGAQCGCHNWYDNMASWEEIALSNIWPIVLEKFLLFQKEIKERSKIPDVFIQEIKPKL